MQEGDSRRLFRTGEDENELRMYSCSLNVCVADFARVMGTNEGKLAEQHGISSGTDSLNSGSKAIKGSAAMFTFASWEYGANDI